jgi:nicotinamidase-related amidase
MQTTCLILIDIQNDYFPGGRMELPASERAVLMARRLLDFFRERQYPVIHIQHISVRRGATFFLPQTAGAEIHASVLPLATEIVIQKNYPNSFRETDLLMHLRRHNIQKLVIAGMMTHMCVDATVRAATDYGFECWTAQDACATSDLKLENRVVPAEDVHAAFLAAIHGTYGRVMDTEQIIKRLQGQP